MKNAQQFLLGLLSGTICASALSVGTVFSLVTAFDLPANATWLALACIGLSLLLALILSLHRSRLVFSAAAAIAFVITLLKWAAIRDGFLLTVELILGEYAYGYDFLSGIAPMFDLPDDAKATAFFILLGGVQALFAALAVLRRESMWLLAGVNAPLLILCFLLVNTVPSAWCLLLALGAYVLLFLTHSARATNPDAGLRLTVRLLLPTVLLMAALTFLVHPSVYTRSQWPDLLQERLNQVVDSLSIFHRDEETGELELFSPIAASTLGSYYWDSGLEDTDLSRAGPRKLSGRHVMELLAYESGPLYLRGSSLAAYEDNSWSALGESVYTGAGISPDVWLSPAEWEGEVRIRTDKKCSLYYLPYTPTALPIDAVVKNDAWVGNSALDIDYTIAYASRPLAGASTEDYERFVRENYLTVPEETRQGLSGVLNQLGCDSTDAPAEIARAVGDFVKNSAAYDLDTPRMPQNEDFVCWFLLESDSGYCVHFATAAAVLLRCMDVPARYVTGYLADAEAGAWTSVTGDDAHAWVEYYVSGQGWQLLDPTPGTGAGFTEDVENTPEPEDTTEPERTTAPAPQSTPSANMPASPSVSTSPHNAGPSEEGAGEAAQKGHALTVFIWVLPGLVVTLFLCRALLRLWRRHELESGPVNRRALAAYRHILRLSALAGAEIPPFAEELALKARFSQHTVSDEEFNRLRVYVQVLTSALKEDRNPFKYLFYRLILGL